MLLCFRHLEKGSPDKGEVSLHTALPSMPTCSDGCAQVIFASELLRWPGFVEFDDVNDKVLTYSAEDK